jgi:succinyl-CoA synthetase beta subunit
MAEAKPKVVLINIFGGITKCDTVASGLLQAFKDGGLDLPIVARIKGVNEQEAVEMLKGTRIQPVLSLDDAAKAAVKIAGGGG